MKFQNCILINFVADAQTDVPPSGHLGGKELCV